MKSVGEKLRRERIDRGIDLAQLASLTRISHRYLVAIETGNTADLPSGFFYRSFVRQYAIALGLDAAEIEADLERVRLAEEPILTAALEQATFPVKSPDPIVMEGNRRYLGTGRMWAYLVLLVTVLVGCSAFYAWWKRQEANPAIRPGDSIEVAQTAPQTTPERTTKAETPPPPITEQPPRTASERPSPPPQSDGMTLAPASNSPPPPKTPAVSPDDRVVVRLSATELSWVSVFEDGKSVFSGLLRPNQTITLGGKERTQVKLGNAGGVEISWNGKTIGPIGPKGQVRTLQLTPETYRVSGSDGSL